MEANKKFIYHLTSKEDLSDNPIYNGTLI